MHHNYGYTEASVSPTLLHTSTKSTAPDDPVIVAEISLSDADTVLDSVWCNPCAELFNADKWADGELDRTG